VHRCTFAAKVEQLLADAPELRAALEPLLEARNLMRKQKAMLDRQLAKVARKDPVCKRLMTVAGVGPIVSLAFKATIDDPGRFQEVQGSRGASGTDAACLPIRRARPIGQHQQVRRQDDAACALRSGELASAHLQEVVDAAGLGREARQTDRRQEGLRSRGAQACDHHASDVGGRHGVPLWLGAGPSRSIASSRRSRYAA